MGWNGNARALGGTALCGFAGAVGFLVVASGSSAAPPEPAGEVSADVLAPRALNPKFAPGAAVYKQYCAACHDSGAGRAPQPSFLQDMTPRTIHRSLTEGVMRTQGSMLTEVQRVAVSEFLANRRLEAAAAAPENACRGTAARFDVNELPAFTGWGWDPQQTHAVTAAHAGLTAADLPKLKLKWAFGFPDSDRARSQPALAGGALLVGSHNGSVYALDRATGCTRWRFQAEAEVRTAIVVAPWRQGDAGARPLAYFGDVAGNAYAVEAFTGKPAWKVSVDDHPAAVVTAAPALHGTTLYVPVSSLEEASAATPGYPCCSFRGSLLALDAATGAVKWRTWLAPPAKSLGASKDGSERFGPSGVPVWNTPMIDAARGQLTLATGDNYSNPATDLSDSILALDLVTGRIKWRYQATKGDVWNVACMIKDSPACPEDAGPDYDFGAGTVLARDANGRELLLAAQKSGIAYALDPDSGKLVWQTRVGHGGAGGGINFGLAAANGRAFFPVSDLAFGPEGDYPWSPGLHAVDLASGKIAWRAPAPGDCTGKPLCRPGYSGSVSVAGSLVMVGADDAVLRIYESATGKLLWSYDTARDVPTVNRVKARGGAIGGGVAPIVWGGQLIVPAGYGFAGKMPGNALLVFETD